MNVFEIRIYEDWQKQEKSCCRKNRKFYCFAYLPEVPLFQSSSKLERLAIPVTALEHNILVDSFLQRAVCLFVSVQGMHGIKNQFNKLTLNDPLMFE